MSLALVAVSREEVRSARLKDNVEAVSGNAWRKAGSIARLVRDVNADQLDRPLLSIVEVYLRNAAGM